MVDTIGPTRLWALSLVDPIGMWTLSQKYDCGHYRTVGTIAGDLTLSQKYHCGRYRTVGTIVSDRGHYRIRSTKAVLADLGGGTPKPDGARKTQGAWPESAPLSANLAQ